jgi:hypothetical protein
MSEDCDDRDADVIIIPHGSGTSGGTPTTGTTPFTGGGIINFDDILNSAPPATGGGLISPGGTVNIPTGGDYPLPPVPNNTIITTPGDDRLIFYVIPPPVPDVGLPPPVDTCTPVPGPGGGTGGGTTAGLDSQGQRAIFPSKPGGVNLTNPGVEFMTRHYASGMSDDPSVEVTFSVPSGHQMDLEVTAIVQMNGMNHNDTIDWKLRGPGHSDGSGKRWYCIDQETNGGHGTCLQVESPHPHMTDNTSKVSKYFSPPNISRARLGWKGLAVNRDANSCYLACWVNMTPDDQSGWKKVWDVMDTGQISGGAPRTAATGGNVQFRCDGISSHPSFTKASCREISWNASSAAATTSTGAPV